MSQTHCCKKIYYKLKTVIFCCFKSPLHFHLFSLHNYKTSTNNKKNMKTKTKTKTNTKPLRCNKSYTIRTGGTDNWSKGNFYSLTSNNNSKSDSKRNKNWLCKEVPTFFMRPLYIWPSSHLLRTKFVVENLIRPCGKQHISMSKL